jgi:RHS repeat-associated protein
VLKLATSPSKTEATLYLHGLSEYPLVDKVDNGESVYERLYIYGNTGLIAIREQSSETYIIRDHLGSTRLAISQDGSAGYAYSYDALGKIIAEGSWGNAESLAWARYFYTGQERDEETGLQNFRARFYDEDLFRFYAMDPAGQFASPYCFAGNAPILMVDRDGRLAWFIPIIIGAAIGAGSNVASNWDAITAGGSIDWGKLGSFAGVGAVSGAVGAASAFAGPFAPLLWSASGSISGGGNALLRGESFLSGAGLGAASGLVGGAAGSWAGNTIGSVVINGMNISSPALQGAIGGAIGGLFGGGVAGGVGAALTGGNIGEGIWNGAKSGAFTGSVTGTIASVSTALIQGKNPFIGNKVKVPPPEPETQTSSGTQSSGGVYIPQDKDGNPIPLERHYPDKRSNLDIPKPDPNAQGAHTVLGGKVSSETGVLYRQSAEFSSGTWTPATGTHNIPFFETHWSHHGRPLIHTVPHNHYYNYDFQKNMFFRSQAKPFIFRFNP